MTYDYKVASVVSFYILIYFQLVCKQDLNVTEHP